MSLRINDLAPDFTAETTQGRISFHAWLGTSWGILFSHPQDFTPVCTTELGAVAKLAPEFARRDVKVIGLSIDSVERHLRWLEDIAETEGALPSFPLIADPTLEIAKLYDMLPASATGVASTRTAADNLTVRNVYVIGPDKRIEMSIAYPLETGRNFDEILRVVDALQLTAAHRVATPANWAHGDDCIIPPVISNDEASKMYPGGWRSAKPYLRYVAQPDARVRWAKRGIATYDAPVETVFEYLSAGGHPHKAFRSQHLAHVEDDVVALDAEIALPGRPPERVTLRHAFTRPNGVVTTLEGGLLDGAQLVQMYTSCLGRTRVDVAGEFPVLPGMGEAAELEMIDGFISNLFAEDEATLRTWKAGAR